MSSPSLSTLLGMFPIRLACSGSSDGCLAIRRMRIPERPAWLAFFGAATGPSGTRRDDFPPWWACRERRSGGLNEPHFEPDWTGVQYETADAARRRVRCFAVLPL